MRRILVPAVAAAVLCSTGVSWADPSSAPKNDGTAVSGVTVTGRKNADVRKTFPSVVDKFVQSHVADGPHGNLTRWMTGLCPAVDGLTPEFNAFIYHRLLAVAEEVGAPKAKPGECVHTNVLVRFTTEPQKLIDDVRDHHPVFLGYHYLSDTKAIATFQPPIKAWYATAGRDAAGLSLLDIAQPPCGAGDLSCTPVTQGTGRLRVGLPSEFVHVLVVVDPKVLGDEPIGRIADYIADEVLSNPGARTGCSSLPSILDALDPACPSSDSVDGLTAYDKAFLKGLYASEPDTQSSFQRGDIFRRILNETRPPAPVTGR